MANFLKQTDDEGGTYLDTSLIEDIKVFAVNGGFGVMVITARAEWVAARNLDEFRAVWLAAAIRKRVKKTSTPEILSIPILLKSAPKPPRATTV